MTCCVCDTIYFVFCYSEHFSIIFVTLRLVRDFVYYVIMYPRKCCSTYPVFVVYVL